MENALAMVDVEEKVESKVERKSSAERELDDAADKVKAGVKAMGKNLTDHGRDLETEYNIEKVREKLG
jgi:hypothetical protein